MSLAVDSNPHIAKHVAFTTAISPIFHRNILNKDIAPKLYLVPHAVLAHLHSIGVSRSVHCLHANGRNLALVSAVTTTE